MLQRDTDRRQTVIQSVTKALSRGGGGLRRFAELLLAQGTTEDLEAIPPAALASLARESWQAFSLRAPGTRRVRVYNPRGGGALDEITVVEALNDNMPFLLDSAMAELQERGCDIRLVLHPILLVERGAKGELKAFPGEGEESPDGPARRESLIHVHIGRIELEEERQALAAALDSVFDEVRTVVSDWRAMLERLVTEIAGYKTSPPPIPVDEIAEAVQFLEWMVDNNFTFLGLREYAFVGPQSEGRLERVEGPEGAGLGILRDPEVKVLRRGREFVSITPEIREFLTRPVPLIVTKANVKARVHRRAHLDYIGLKTFDGQGRLTGELRVVGLFTSSAYNRSVRSIPYLRRKVDLVMRRAGFDAASHSGKALLNVLETFPRDELFQIDEDVLFDWSVEILQLGERPRIRVLTRADRFDRFVSALVFVPRDRFNTRVREEIGALLADAFEGRVSAWYPSFPEGTLVRVHYIVGRYEGDTPAPDRRWLEGEVARIVRTWEDNLRRALAEAHPPDRAQALTRGYAGAFPDQYQATYAPETAITDMAIIDGLDDAVPLAIDFHRLPETDDRRLDLKLFRLGQPVPLSERVPILECMGFRVINERSFPIGRPGCDEGSRVWLHDMVLERADGEAIDLDALDAPLTDCYMAVCRGEAENDGYNALVVKTGLPWREVAVIRAYSRYLRQIRSPFSQDYMWQTLARHHRVAALLADLFRTRFDPGLRGRPSREAREDAIVADIEEALENVPSLDEDRILRRFANVIRATLRTNVYQREDDGSPKPAMSFKLASRLVDDLPDPRPFAEIFVYSPRVEGVHLRFGKIARGGIRWSDRPQDFRTEVLGLAKAQQVKNAVIVPVGAKGGFVPKRPIASDRDAVQAEGIECYRIYVSSMLDITDNLTEDGLAPPAEVVRRDDDDPYLVVAADKGTATFSDIANAISVSRDFWLGDAFASGGSAGYDHKKMAITARGAWEAVKRHFREIDIDIQATPFTVVGCGDMSGDVFGNGMLLSDRIRLIAAFDHRDIFIDPDPDPEKGFAERRRLFDLPRSSWQDYSRDAISKGGGVFSRTAKSIGLSPEIQDVLDLTGKTATPAEVIGAILRARADLMWFGGIGTYVRANEESDEEAGDRANDAVRVTGRDLRVRVVGEGANLAMTQRGRIEFALAGGRVNTDAIDNSGGVNSSDLEVNIKIALSPAVRTGKLKPARRNRLLADMTGEVAALVLRNNYLQTLAISLSAGRGLEDMGFQRRLLRDLEERGLMDRAVEVMPDDAELESREGRGEPLTRPEIAVLLAYAKIDLFDRLLESPVPDEPYLGRELHRYFPEKLRRRYADCIEAHRLRREIISTMLANSMINRGGPTMVMRLADETGADVSAIASAFAAARNAFSLTELNDRIDALDGRVAGAVQLGLHRQVQDLLLGATAWFLRNIDLSAGLEDVVEHYRARLDVLAASLEECVPSDAVEEIAARREELRDEDVSGPLAEHMARLPWLARGPDIVRICDHTGKPMDAVARTYFALSAFFRLPALEAAARGMEAVGYYDRLALNRTLDLITEAQRRLVAEMLDSGRSGPEALEAWLERRGGQAERAERALADAERGPMTLARLAVAASLLRDLAGD